MQTTLPGLVRVLLNAWTRHSGMCPGTDTWARPSTWEPPQACACSSECAHALTWLALGPHSSLSTGRGPHALSSKQPWAGTVLAGQVVTMYLSGRIMATWEEPLRVHPVSQPHQSRGLGQCARGCDAEADSVPL